MTVLSAPAAPGTAARSLPRLRLLLRVDGVGTAALGVAALVAARPLAELVASPAVLRGVGVLFLVVGADMLLSSRLSDRRLPAAARLLGAADLGFAAVAVAAVVAGAASGAGVALALAVAAVCVLMGAAKLRLAG
jgi:hypothetical protein